MPDFYLPRAKLWCEVKGDPDGLRNEKARMCAVLQEGGPLPLVILGDIPNVPQEIVMHPCFFRDDKRGLCRSAAIFGVTTNPDQVGVFDAIPDSVRTIIGLIGLGVDMRADLDAPGDRSDDAWDIAYQSARLSVGFSRTASDAYQAARQARFEHGAKGAI